ncbi:MAG: hypothetical protein GXY76_07065 [Chloroflexi bacterium]|nr:hypothetical protein [Chloroflexota bacterium]
MERHHSRQGPPVRTGHLRRFLALAALCLGLLLCFGSVALADSQWSGFLPETWVRYNVVTCQVQVTDPLGLTEEAEYRYSTTGNIGIAPWLSANLQVTGALSTTKSIMVTNLAFPDSASQNLVQFRLKRTDQSYAQSPSYPVFVDATAPQNPTTAASTSHTAQRWSRDTTIDMAWSGAVDAASGVFGYSYVWDTSAATLPPDAPNTTATQATSLPLSDGDSHYFHLRTRDNAGNWAGSAVHVGPFWIDTVPPTNPATLSSPSHTAGAWSATNVIQASWSAGADGLGGIGGYSLVWDNLPTTLPDTITETVALIAASPAMDDSSSIWFHLRTVDKADNWTSDAKHLGPFMVDRQPPTNPTTFTMSHLPGSWSNDTTIDISWEGAADAGSGVAGYAYAWTEQAGTIPDPTIRTTGSQATSPTLAHNKSYYFHLRTADQMGNWSDTVHRGPFNIDTEPPTSPSILSVEPPGWANQDAFTVRWEINPFDPSGIGGAYCKVGAAPQSNADYTLRVQGDNLKAITNIHVGGDGIYEVYVWLEDKAGNKDYRTWARPFSPFRLDTIPPQSQHTLDRVPDHSGWYTDTMTVYLTAQDSLSRVSVISYTIDAGPWRSLSETSFAVETEGVHDIRYFAADNAGNRETTRTITPNIRIDLNPPLSAVSYISSTVGLLGWRTSQAEVGLAATDAASGVAEIWHRYRPVGGVWSAWSEGATFLLIQEGEFEAQHYAVDYAGHVEAVRDVEGTINIDLVPPTTSHSLQGTAGENGWYTKSPVAVTLAASDSRSGVQETRYRVDQETTWRLWTGTPFNIYGEGVHSVEYYSTDKAGNVETAHRFQLGMDATAPTMASLPQVSPSAQWYNKADFTLTWANPTNELSGVVGAFYKYGDQEPGSNNDYSGVCQDTKIITHCTGLELPGEGRFGIWVWLKDRAGNRDFDTRRYRSNVLWYDATPPHTEVLIEGVQEGLWYTSAVTLTFQATDPVPAGVNGVSGAKAIYYSIGCTAPWQESARLVLAEEGTTTVCFRAVDNAGNVEATQSRRIRINLGGPLPPENVQVAPASWTSQNRFTITWENPPDLSGIAGAYYSFTQPTRHEDGTFIVGSDSCLGTCSGEISVPSEGALDLYLWVRNGAGNSGWANAEHLVGAFHYDVTPPTSHHELAEGIPGREGWWVSPVKVRLISEDAGSGVAAIYYRLRPADQAWGDWQTYTGPFWLSSSGLTSVRYYAKDVTGHEEATLEFSVKIDATAPRSWITALPQETDAPTPQLNISVKWDGLDALSGSGLAAFGVQVKDGLSGSWAQWISGTLQKSGLFAALPGHVYYFRSQARDVAGNVGGPFGSGLIGETRTYVQSVVNGSFRTPNLASWQYGGPLRAREVPAESWNGTVKPLALLGLPELGRGFDPDRIPITPVGYGAITQTITIPALEDLANPTLSFWYRVISYDVLYTSDQRLYDSFDAYILTGTGEKLILRDGNTGPFSETMPPADSGWKLKQYSLAAYAGQTIGIRFACYNRNDKAYNTWAYVDDIRVSGAFETRTWLPSILNNR